MGDADVAEAASSPCPSCGRRVSGEYVTDDGIRQMRYVCRSCPAVQGLLGHTVDITWYRLLGPEVVDYPIDSDGEGCLTYDETT